MGRGARRGVSGNRRRGAAPLIDPLGRQAMNWIGRWALGRPNLGRGRCGAFNGACWPCSIRCCHRPDRLSLRGGVRQVCRRWAGLSLLKVLRRSGRSHLRRLGCKGSHMLWARTAGGGQALGVQPVMGRRGDVLSKRVLCSIRLERGGRSWQARGRLQLAWIGVARCRWQGGRLHGLGDPAVRSRLDSGCSRSLSRHRRAGPQFGLAGLNLTASEPFERQSAGTFLGRLHFRCR